MRIRVSEHERVDEEKINKATETHHPFQFIHKVGTPPPSLLASKYQKMQAAMCCACNFAQWEIMVQQIKNNR